MRHWSSVALLAAALALAGCGNPSSSSPAESASPAETGESAGPKTYAAADLPAVGEALPPLDQGRVEFAPPSGWRVLSRDSKYLARFVKGKAVNELPRITVTAMSAEEGIGDVSEESVSEFAEQMQAKSEAVPGRRLLEPCRPIILGDHAWSRHVRYVLANRNPAIVQALETARGGRLYIIELTAPAQGESNEEFAKAILSHRDAAYAVAANWKFVGEPGPPAGKTVADQPGDAKASDAGEESPP